MILSLLKISIAEAAVNSTAFGKLINPIIDTVVYPIVQLMFGLAVLYFVWGALQIVLHGADEGAREKGKLTMLWGSVGIFIMVSAWGIIYFVSNTVKDLAN